MFDFKTMYTNIFLTPMRICIKKKGREKFEAQISTHALVMEITALCSIISCRFFPLCLVLFA